MSAYPDGRACVIDEHLQIHHISCDVFENSIDQEGTTVKEQNTPHRHQPQQ